jgi:hypothetical protein
VWSQVSDAGDDGSAAHEALLPYQPPSQSFQNLLAQASQQMAQVADAIQQVPAAPIACGRSPFTSISSDGGSQYRMAVATAQNWLAQARQFTSPADARPAVIARIAELEAENDRLRGLLARVDEATGPNYQTITLWRDEAVRGLEAFGAHLIWWPDELPVPLAVGEQGSRVMKMPEEIISDDPVRADVERTIDHLQRHLVQDKQFGDLKKAVEQAGRTNGKSDAAINDIRGRALR